MRIVHYLQRMHLAEGGVMRAVLDLCNLLAGAGYTYAPYVVFPPFGYQLIPTTAYGQPVAYYQTAFELFRQRRYN